MVNAFGSPKGRIVVANEQGVIAPTDSQYESTEDKVSTILDRDWVQNAFMMPDSGFSDDTDIKANRYYSTANMKFTDTRLGASIGINPRPSFCQYSDVPVPGRLSRNEPSINDFNGNYGLGRQYSEFLDDPAQRIYMTFGVPQFNSLIQFFRAAYESNQMTLARTGRATSIFYSAGKLIGSAALLYTFPLISVGLFVGKLFDFFVSKPKSKFYSMKPTMHLYWSAVNQLVQAMTVNRGILPKFLASKEKQRTGKAYELDQDFIAGLSNLMPGIFRDAGLGVHVFDIFAVATRAQRIADKILINEYKEIDQGTATYFLGYVNKTMTGRGGHSTSLTNEDGEVTLSAKVDHYLNTTVLIDKLFAAVENVKAYMVADANDQGIDVDPRSDPKKAEEEGRGFFDHFDANLRQGAQFATFIVDHTGPQSESWSNSVTDSELQQKLNGAVSNMSEARFSLAEGSIIGGIAGDVVGAAANAVTGMVKGVLSGITGGLSQTIEGLAGGGYIDIPKHWSQSSFNGTKTHYSMQLISPYGNPFSQLMSIDIPLAMLMAGTLPRSTGKASYTAPLLCQIFDRGRCQIRLGMIESLSFTRGTSHLGFTDTGAALSVYVSFSVVDLSSNMHMPISSGIFDGIDMTMDEDNILQDYLAVLAGQSLESQIYNIPRIRLQVAKKIMNLSRLTSPAYYASVFSNNPVSNFMSMFTRSTAALDFTGSTI